MLVRAPARGPGPPLVLPQPPPPEIFSMAARGTVSPPHLHVRVRVVAAAPAVLPEN